ncbi:MAG: prepilin peptidase [Alphaproteobacteria bacterium]|nr:prepilin peptidase [Alphaproteobacteria bacterium]
MPIALPMLFTYALSACMLWVVVSDATRYIIPNTLNLALLVLYVAAALLLPVSPWLPALCAAALMLAVGLGLFMLGLMGGGDIKLLVVLSLWTGWGVTTSQFIFLTAIFGGVLVFVVLMLRAVIAPVWVKTFPRRNLPRLLTRKQPVPYGLAIATSFTWLLWTGAIAGLNG